MKKCLNSYEFEKKLPLLFAGFNGKKCMCRIWKKKLFHKHSASPYFNTSKIHNKLRSHSIDHFAYPNGWHGNSAKIFHQPKLSKRMLTLQPLYSIDFMRIFLMINEVVFECILLLNIFSHLHFVIFSIQRSCDNKMPLSNRFSPENMCYFFCVANFSIVSDEIFSNNFKILLLIQFGANIAKHMKLEYGVAWVGELCEGKKNKTLNWLLIFCCFSKKQIRFKS